MEARSVSEGTSIARRVPLAAVGAAGLASAEPEQGFLRHMRPRAAIWNRHLQAGSAPLGTGQARLRQPRPVAPARPRLRVGLPVGLALLLAGCGSTSTQPTPPTQMPATPLTWVEQDIEHEGMKISLGHRGQEPIAAITRDGQPVANAMVFCRLMTDDREPMVGVDEAATVYELPTGKDPGLYAQGKLSLPEGVTRFHVRFRIVLPNTEPEWTRDIEIPLK